jgi:hypothetical protein
MGRPARCPVTCGADSSGIFLSTTLTAPQAPGVHTITVCRPACDSIDTPWRESGSFTVLAVVPDLGSLSLADARRQLDQASLILGTVQGPSDDPAARVSGQVPQPGTPVDPGGAVNVTVKAPTPTTLVTVPALLGRTRAEANALVTGEGLVLQVNSGTGPGREPRSAARQPGRTGQRDLTGVVSAGLGGRSRRGWPELRRRQRFRGVRRLGVTRDRPSDRHGPDPDTLSWDAGPARIQGLGHPDRLNLPTDCSSFCSTG